MENPREETMEVMQSVDEFAACITFWHTNRISQLKQALETPDTVAIIVQDDKSGEDVELTPDQRVGFKAGLLVALSLFEDLPFAVLPEFEDEGNDKDLPSEDQE